MKNPKRINDILKWSYLGIIALAFSWVIWCFEYTMQTVYWIGCVGASALMAFSYWKLALKYHKWAFDLPNYHEDYKVLEVSLFFSVVFVWLGLFFCLISFLAFNIVNTNWIIENPENYLDFLKRHLP